MTGGTLSTGQSGLPTPLPTASFWLCEPSPVLLGHRSTPDLPRAADVVVVGSGIAGAFAAWHLLAGDGRRPPGKAARPRKSVVMLEAREACEGATGRVGVLSLQRALLIRTCTERWPLPARDIPRDPSDRPLRACQLGAHPLPRRQT